MNLIDTLKPNKIKVFLTLFLGFLVYLIGSFVCNNPVFLKIGCAPNPSCPYCESCLSWGFPEIINPSAFVLVIPLYLIASLIYQVIWGRK